MMQVFLTVLELRFVYRLDLWGVGAGAFVVAQDLRLLVDSAVFFGEVCEREESGLDGALVTVWEVIDTLRNRIK
jgi:hypothetical protein